MPVSVNCVVSSAPSFWRIRLTFHLWPALGSQSPDGVEITLLK